MTKGSQVVERDFCREQTNGPGRAPEIYSTFRTGRLRTPFHTAAFSRIHDQLTLRRLIYMATNKEEFLVGGGAVVNVQTTLAARGAPVGSCAPVVTVAVNKVL